MNLVTNAFIYNKSREKVVTIKLEVIGKNLVMDIIDNGIGVDKDELRKIFRKSSIRWGNHERLRTWSLHCPEYCETS